MFKVGKSKHKKIKAVFKLHFQTTQVANPGSRLLVSVVPADVGQPTVKLGKAKVKEDGNCTWDNPVYETVKLTRETKTGKIQDKFYYFIVSTGSSKKGLLGEVPINFADFLDDVVPVIISLPINDSNPTAVLHVTIQNVQGATDSRHTEEYGDGVADNSQNKSLRSQLSDSTLGRGSDRDSKDDEFYETAFPRGTERGRSFGDFISPSEQRLNHQPRKSSVDKQHEQHKGGSRFPLETSSSEQSPSRNPMPWSKMSKTVATYNGDESPNLAWSSPELIVNSAARSEDRNQTRKEQETSSNSVEQLKKEIASLERQAEVTGIELQSLRRQIQKESQRGQQLTRQVSTLKEERDALREECDKLSLKTSRKSSYGDEKSSKLSIDGEIDEVEDCGEDQLAELKQEVTHLKNINKLLRRNLGKTQDSNSELVLVVKDLERKLEKKDTEVAYLSNQTRGELLRSTDAEDLHNKLGRDRKVIVPEELILNANGAVDEEEVNHLRQRIEELEVKLDDQAELKYRLEMNLKQTREDLEITKQQKSDIFSMLEQAQIQVTEKEKQCTCYVNVIEELESEIERLEKVIENQAGEFSESSDTAGRLKIQIENLQNQLEDQIHEYEHIIGEINEAKTEQEERALQLEEELRKTKMNHTVTAQRVQEEFNQLSADMKTKFNENEKLVIEAQAEATTLQLQVKELEEELQKAKGEMSLMITKQDSETNDFAGQLEEKDRQLEQLMLKLQEECKVLKSAKQKQEQKCEAYSKENEALRVEMERLTEENYHLSKQSEKTKNLRAELELITGSTNETNRLLEVTAREKDDLEKKYETTRKEATRSEKELDALKLTIENKQETIGILQSDLQKLKAEQEEVKNQFLVEKSETKSLKKLVSQQKEELKIKDQVLANKDEIISKHDASSKEAANAKEKPKQLKAVRGSGTPNGNGNKVDEKRNTGKKQQLPETSTSGSFLQNGTSKTPGKSQRESSINEGEIARLLAEVAEMKEKNKSMEGELKEMQDKYSDVSLRFAEVESERQQLVMTVRNLRNGQRK